MFCTSRTSKVGLPRLRLGGKWELSSNLPLEVVSGSQGNVSPCSPVF